MPDIVRFRTACRSGLNQLFAVSEPAFGPLPYAFSAQPSYGPSSYGPSSRSTATARAAAAPIATLIDASSEPGLDRVKTAAA